MKKKQVEILGRSCERSGSHREGTLCAGHPDLHLASSGEGLSSCFSMLVFRSTGRAGMVSSARGPGPCVITTVDTANWRQCLEQVSVPSRF